MGVVLAVMVLYTALSFYTARRCEVLEREVRTLARQSAYIAGFKSGFLDGRDNVLRDVDTILSEALAYAIHVESESLQRGHR